MQLSPNFTLEELTFSSTATRLGIVNTPTPEVIANLTTLCNTLEKVSSLLGHPMHIDSGYRSRALNYAVGGAIDSAHISGYAADFVCPAFGIPLEIVKAVAGSGIKFDQAIFEGTWTHLSVAPTMRQQILTAQFKHGGVEYREGI